LVNAAGTGCPQFVQKLVPDSSFVPHEVQKGFGVGTAIFASSGASTATA